MFSNENKEREESMKRVSLGLVIVVSMLAGGCTKYYQVSDPSTGRVYYTTGLKDTGGGSIQLKDERTGGEVTIQNSEVKTITKDEYDRGRLVGPTSNPK